MPAEIDYAKEEAELKAGKRVQEFLTDPHVKKSIADRQAVLARDIFRAKSPEAALDLWYVGRALEDALSALKVTADAAEYVEGVRVERERVASRQRREPR